MNRLDRFNVPGEFLARVDLVNRQTAAAKLAGGLSQQVNAIDDEIELGDDGLRRK